MQSSVHSTGSTKESINGTETIAEMRNLLRTGALTLSFMARLAGEMIERRVEFKDLLPEAKQEDPKARDALLITLQNSIRKLNTLKQELRANESEDLSKLQDNQKVIEAISDLSEQIKVFSPTVRDELAQGLRAADRALAQRPVSSEAFLKLLRSNGASDQVVGAVEFLPAELLGLPTSTAVQTPSAAEEQARTPLSEAELIKRLLNLLRERFIDTGLRANPLLNYRPSRAERGIEVLDERTSVVYNTLVDRRKTMSFEECPEELEDTAVDALKQPADTEDLEAHHKDTVLRTAHKASLQKRLLNTAHDAQIALRENGLNSLYVAMGMVHWQPKGDSKVRKAPLILVPVELSRRSAKGRFRVKYTGEDLEPNLPLINRMKEEFGIDLPEMRPGADFSPVKYLAAVKRALAKASMEGVLEVHSNEMVVNRFSSGKGYLYRDLDPKGWPEHRRPEDQPHVRALLGVRELEKPKRNGAQLDYDREVTHSSVVDCDGSQLEAQLGALQSDVAVVNGPPGTGKTQVVASILSAILKRGETALVLSKKLVALEQPQERLEHVGLGNACLALHSNNMPKTKIVRAIGDTVRLGEPVEGYSTSAAEKVEACQERLQDYLAAITTPIGESGVSPYEAMSRLLELGKHNPDLPDVGSEQLATMPASELALVQQVVTELDELRGRVGSPRDNVFFGSQRHSISLDEQRRLDDELGAAQQDLAKLQAATSAVFGKLGLSENIKFGDVEQFFEALEKIAKAPNHLVAIDVNNPAWVDDRREVEAMLKDLEAQSALVQKWGNVISQTGWREHITDIIPLKRQIEEYDGWTGFARNFFRPSYYKMRDRLFEIATDKVPEIKEERLAMLDAISEGRRLERDIKSRNKLGLELIGFFWASDRQDFRSWDPKDAVKMGRWVVEFTDTFKEHPLRETLLTLTQKPEPLTKLKKEVGELRECHKRYKAALARVQSTLDYRADVASEKFTSVGFDAHAQLLDSYRLALQDETGNQLEDLFRFNRAVAPLVARGLSTLISDAETRSRDAGDLSVALEASTLRGIMDRGTIARPVLLEFDPRAHDRLVAEYRTAERKLFRENSIALNHEHFEAIPRGALGGQAGVLTREVLEKKTSFLPTREFYEKAGNAILRTKPIHLMGPEAVSKYLPRGLVFDWILVDEGSQVRPEEVLPAVMRGSKLMVLGDGKQLPPTAFFEASFDRNGDDHLGSFGQEKSILDVLVSKGVPTWTLRNAYRFEDDSLITVSNVLFYDGQLITFPSPVIDRTERGFHYRQLSEASYDRGKSRTNPEEARTVAEAVLEHARKHPDQSLGVVAMSEAQMDAIYREVERLRVEHSELDTYFERHEDEPLIIVNLENIQGDERDVLMVSVGYGWDEDNKLLRNFGPINSEGGENRLNVVFSRSRRRTEVFTNMAPEDLGYEADRAEGVKALQAYLYYARDGKVPGLIERESREVTGIAKFIKESLEERGYTVEPNPGHPECGLDLAVVDPNNDKRFALGIMTDGDAYQQASAIRDRERVREEVLGRRGWDTYRVWTAGFFKDPARELDLLEEAIKAASADPEAGHPRYERPQPITVVRRGYDETTARGTFSQPYVKAAVEVSNLLSGAELLDHLREKVREVVDVEGPVHVREVQRRLREAAGYIRARKSFDEPVAQVIREEVQAGNLRERNRFLIPGNDTDTLRRNRTIPRDRSELRTYYRQAALISSDEIRASIRKVVSTAHGIEESELPDACCSRNVLGFRNGAPKDAGQVFRFQLADLKAEGEIEERGGYLFATDKCLTALKEAEATLSATVDI